MTNYQIILQAFRNLEPEQRKALAYHAKRKTPVICGTRDAGFLFTDGKGGG